MSGVVGSGTLGHSVGVALPGAQRLEGVPVRTLPLAAGWRQASRARGRVGV